MSILIDENTRVLAQGLTGAQGTRDAEFCLRYGTKIVCGVTPGKGGVEVHNLPVYGSVKEACQQHQVDASVVYAPPLSTKEAVIEALEAGLKLIVALAEFVPRHDTAVIAAAARENGAVVIGCNTNGIISPGKSKLGAIGGDDPSEVFAPGRIGVVSRSGGMSAELSLAVKRGGLGVSTCISMGGDVIPGNPMVDYIQRFVADPDTDAIVMFGEPGTNAEHEVAAYLRTKACTKPLIALLAGEFQENYPKGVSFGHVAAMINDVEDTVSAKRKMLSAAGAIVVNSLGEIPLKIREQLGS
ncbi:MAG: succinate--CoA ligase subunit alpha [Rhodospirillaceae bacterium]|nr:succinate--CoA ligase subunit alpha [Rhodospirillaceae bacterium]